LWPAIAFRMISSVRNPSCCHLLADKHLALRSLRANHEPTGITNNQGPDFEALSAHKASFRIC
jgi:hypothetical protein